MDTIEAVLRFLPDRVNQRNDLIVTPPRIAEDMINILPDDVWNSSTKFLDPMCKDGIFLYKIYVKLMASESLIAEFPDEMERRNHILHHQLYGVSPDRLCQLMTIRTVYGTLNTESNIKLAKSTNISDIRSIIEKEFNGMQFDIVAGNPPYNRGMDLDFVDLGYSISKKYTVMITPAKWQTAAADQRIASKLTYGQFREKIVPHMCNVCYYPNSLDVFDNVYQIDGITYFCISKAESKHCIVTNKSKDLYDDKGKINDILKRYENTKFIARNEVVRNIDNGESLLNIGQEIIDILGKHEQFRPDYYKNITSGKYKVWINNLVPGNQQISAGGFLGVGKAYIDSNRPDKNQIDCYFASDNVEECKSYLSFLNSKFVRFLLSCNYSKLTGVICDDCFRFVPAPPSGKFDHIYTDAELYKAFNLPQKYIDVIEAVVKERK